MTKDEQAIRDVVDRWLRASASGDVSTMLALLADDMVFVAAPGHFRRLQGVARAVRRPASYCQRLASAQTWDSAFNQSASVCPSAFPRAS